MRYDMGGDGGRSGSRVQGRWLHRSIDWAMGSRLIPPARGVARRLTVRAARPYLCAQPPRCPRCDAACMPVSRPVRGVAPHMAVRHPPPATAGARERDRECVKREEEGLRLTCGSHIFKKLENVDWIATCTPRKTKPL